MVKKKEKSNSLKIVILILGIGFVSFMFGLAFGSGEVVEVEKEVIKEVEVEKEVIVEVEKIVQDTEEIEKHKVVACAFANMYSPMLAVVEDYANYWGVADILTDDMYYLESEAEKYLVQYCK
jgi:hypothetical protein